MQSSSDVGSSRRFRNGVEGGRDCDHHRIDSGGTLTLNETLRRRKMMSEPGRVTEEQKTSER